MHVLAELGHVLMCHVKKRCSFENAVAEETQKLDKKWLSR